MNKYDFSSKKTLLRLALLFLIILVGILWINQAPSKEEAIGSGSILASFWNGVILSPSSLWTPNYMLGYNQVLLYVSTLPFFIEGFFMNLFSQFVEHLVVMKICSLTYLILSGLAMYYFVIRLTKDTFSAILASIAYIVMPSIIVRGVIYEHIAVSLCFFFTPLIFRGIIAVAEDTSPREILLLGLSAAGLALSYTKIALAIMPLIILWTLEALRLNPNKRRSILISYIVSTIIAAGLSLLLLLPAMREFGFTAGFLLDPLDAWQHHYAFKSALQWIDTWGVFMQGAGPNIETDGAMFVIGLIPLLGISLGLGLTSLKEWRSSVIGRWFLILVACWLLSIGFAAGPDGIFLGHWNVLKNAQRMPDASIPLLWLAFFWLLWMTYQTIHFLIGGKAWRALVLFALFLLLPLFRIINMLPYFKDIRAPESFWSIGGFCALAAAVGIVTLPIFTEFVPKRFLKSAIVLTVLLFCAELYPIHSAYWTRGLPSELMSQYDQVLAFLKTAPLAGRVHPISTRYFYLTIPEQAGRALDTEANFRHFQLKWVRYFENAGNTNADTLKSYLNLAGVSYIFIDKEDPLIPKQTQNFYRSSYPLVFENQFFAILENSSSFYPAFLARNFVALPPQSYVMAPATFQLAPMNLLTVEMPQVDQGMLGFAGMSKGNNQIELLPTYREHGGAPFLRVPLATPRLDNYNQMTYRVPPNVSGWLTVTEAYHPDWRATIDGEPAPTYRAETALLSLYVPIGSTEIIFKFVPPLWYSLSLYSGILSWIAALGIFLFLSSKWARSEWKAWWTAQKEKF